MTDFDVRDARTLSERKQTAFHKEKRRKLCITLPPNQYVWLVSRVSEGTYYNISHGLEMCVKETRRHQTKKQD